MIRIPFIALTLLFLCSSNVLGEELRGLKAGKQLRVQTLSGETWVGQLSLSFTDRLGQKNLELTRNGVEHSIPVVDIEKLWVRKSASTELAIIGLMVGGFAGYAAWEFCDNFAIFGEPKGCSMGALPAVLIGGTVGMGIGALIGSAFSSWSLHYSSEQSSPGDSGQSNPGYFAISLRIPLDPR